MIRQGYEMLANYITSYQKLTYYTIQKSTLMPHTFETYPCYTPYNKGIHGREKTN